MRFTHPLLASVAYDSATPWERREAHGRLAVSSEDRVERARHLAASVTELDEDVAADLEASAEIASRRGAPETAAQLADTAARITPSDEDARRRRRLQAADYHIVAGDPDRGRAILEQLAAETGPGPARAVSSSISQTRSARRSRSRYGSARRRWRRPGTIAR